MTSNDPPAVAWSKGLSSCGELRLPGAQQLAYSESLNQVAIWTRGGKLFLRHASKGTGPPALPCEEPVDALFFTDAGQTLVAWRRDQLAQRWQSDPRQGDFVPLAPEAVAPTDGLDDARWQELEAQEDALHLALDPAAQWVVCGSRSGEISVLPRRAEASWRATAQASQSHIIDVCFSFEGNRIASCDLEGLIRLWEPAGGLTEPSEESTSSPLHNTPAEFMPLVERMRHDVTADLPGLASAIATSSMKGPVLLRALLLDPSPRLRYRTLWLLGVDEIWGFSHELVEALHDPNPTVRLASLGAIDALDDTACSQAVQELVEREPQEEVLEQAEKILQRFLG